jgi:hypothetical protein
MVELVLNADEVQALVELLGDASDSKLEAIYSRLVAAELEGAGKAQ